MHRAMRCARGPACIYHWAARLQQGYERRGQRAVSQGEEAAREAGQGTDGLRGDCTCEQRNLQRGRGARGCEGGARRREGGCKEVQRRGGEGAPSHCRHRGRMRWRRSPRRGARGRPRRNARPACLWRRGGGGSGRGVAVESGSGRGVRALLLRVSGGW